MAELIVNFGSIIADEMRKHSASLDVLAEVKTERDRQDVKWGEQNHPMTLTGETSYYRHMADRRKEINTYRANIGTLTWDGILLEEVYEAFAETDPDKQEAELVQVAAVAVAAIEGIRRNRQVAA